MKYKFEKGHGWRAALYFGYLKSGENKDVYLNGDIYQFGVAAGFSMQVLGVMCKLLKINPTFFGFDVFSGMPVEEVDSASQIDKPGEFNVAKIHGVDNVSDAIKILTDDIQCELPYGSKLNIIEGLVQNTLNEDFIKNYSPKPAFYVDFDLDIYSPTKYVFDFMWTHNLIVPGTIIGFDDWNQHWTPEFVYGAAGESRAFKEVVDQYGIKTKLILETQTHDQAAFIVI